MPLQLLSIALNTIHVNIGEIILGLNLFVTNPFE
jgi:hypothetical protein